MRAGDAQQRDMANNAGRAQTVRSSGRGGGIRAIQYRDLQKLSRSRSVRDNETLG
jgi:hypothetical protein